MSLMPTQVAPVSRRGAAATADGVDQSWVSWATPFEGDGADQSLDPTVFPPFEGEGEGDGADQSWNFPPWTIPPFEG